jgi:thioredoxin 1
MIEINKRDFDKEVLECELPVFACFTTKWCHSCYPTCLLGDDLANEYEGRVKFVKVDVVEIPHVSTGYRITAVPTILIFKDSKPVRTLLGFQDRRSLKALLDSVANGSDRPSRKRLETNEVQE